MGASQSSSSASGNQYAHAHAHAQQQQPSSSSSLAAAASSSTSSAAVILGNSYLGELGSDVRYERSLGSSRFLRSIKARFGSSRGHQHQHQHHGRSSSSTPGDGADNSSSSSSDRILVVKVFVKPDPHMDLRPLSKRIANEGAAMMDCPNLLPYAQALATERAGYLIRQWVASSLYDRISTRPFLGPLEKKWIAFQLLTAVRDLHARKLSHGDIKSENVLVTSWNWVYLCDFSSAFKPVYLPEDDPSEFSYYFDTSGRRTCYVAPERFFPADSEIARKVASLEVGRSLGRITEAMDVFSLGCVLGELLVEGAPPFTLSQLYKYKAGQYALDAYLAQIEDDAMRGLVKSMTSLHASDRLSCQQYLTDAYAAVFPASFYDYFHDFIATTNELGSVTSPQPALSRSNGNGSLSGGAMTPVPGQQQQQAQAHDDGVAASPLPSNADEIIGRIWSEFEQMEKHFAVAALPGGLETGAARLEESPFADDAQLHHAAITTERLPINDALYPLHLNVATSGVNASSNPGSSEDGPALLVLSLLCSNIRNCARPSSMSRALDLLLALSPHLADETKLDRMLPFVVSLLTNDAASVRAGALRALTQTLTAIESITPSNATLFPEYILPNVTHFVHDTDEGVRCVYAQSLAALAEAGQRYLDLTQAMKAEGTFKLSRRRGHEYDASPYEMSYDASLLDLQNQIQDQINTLLIDPSPAVRRALVLNITPLCIFLGRARTADVFGLLTTHLNDKDWLLRAAFFESTVGISTCIGSKSVDEYILPLMAEALADNEESVIARELGALSTLAQLGLYQRARLWETLAIVIPLLCHPNLWIRSSAASFIASAAKALPQTDAWCSLYPALRPMLRADIKDIDELGILEASVGPLSRDVYEAAILWAGRSAKSPFWQKSRQKGVDADAPLGKLLNDGTKLPLLSEEDKLEMQKLHMLGMTERDSFKLLAMRDYISSVAVARRNSAQTPSSDPETVVLSTNSEVALASLGVTPQNIIFSTGNEGGGASRAPSRLHQTGNWQRRFSTLDSPRSTSSLDLGRPNGGRSVSGASTTDALRKRLMHGHNLSSTSLSSTSASPRRSSLATRPAYPVSPPASTSAANDTASSSGASYTAGDHLGASSATIRPPGSVAESSTTRQRSKVSAHGVGVAKVSAAVGSDMTTALGQLTSEVDNMSVSGASVQAAKEDGKRFTSTYEGDDPSIKLLLDRVYSDNYREPMPEFGPHVPARVPRKRSIRPGARERIHRRPEGILIGHLVEHTASVTGIAVAPDHAFFATGSADGTVRVWDTIRLEKNVTSRSRQVVHQGGKITTVIVLENTHCIASASDNGSLWISRIDVHAQPGAVPKYGKQAVIRRHTVDSLVSGSSQDYITCMVHYDMDATSTLVYATAQSRIVAMDVRTLRVLQNYQNPPHMGPISCICVDRKHSWLVVGTLSGSMALWDLRFGLLLRTWSVGKGAVHSCHVHKTRGKGRWIVVAFEGSQGFETWDIETGQRVEVFASVVAEAKPTVGERSHRRASSVTTITVRPDEQVRTMREVELSPAAAIQAYLNKEIQPIPRLESDESDPATALHGYENLLRGPAIRTLIIGNDYSNLQEHAGLAVPAGSLPSLSEMTQTLSGSAGATAARVRERAASTTGQGTPHQLGYIITGGEDHKLRFWDLGDADGSAIICGADEGEDKGIAYSRGKVGSCSTFTETRPVLKSIPSGPNRRQTLVANNQQTLLKAHQDAITAIALLELPFRCIVSADRSGVIKVWE